MTDNSCSNIGLNSDNSHTWIKICGITREEDAAFASHMNVDAIGLVFYPPSSRNLTPEKARKIKDGLFNSVSSIAVVVDPDDTLLDKIVNEVKVDCIQFHGNEPPERCSEIGIPYIKALRVRSTRQILDIIKKHKHAAGFLLDAYESERVGGTGNTFNWDLIPPLEVPVVIAGGLNADNITTVMRKVQPAGVDVSTGVESSAGVKSQSAIHNFVNEVRLEDGLSARTGRGGDS